MAVGSVKVPVRDVMRKVTVNVTVTGMRGFRVRMWIGTRMLRLAARIMRMGIKIRTTDEDSTQ